MDNTLGFVMLSVSVFIAAVLIIMTSRLINVGTRYATSTATSLSQIITAEDADFAVVNGELSGARVKELINEFNDKGIYTLTVTKACPSGFYNSKNMNDTGSTHYVQDNASFHATLERNEANTVIGIQFVESGQSKVEFDYDDAADSLDSVEAAVLKRQLQAFNFAKNNLDLCRENIAAYSTWASYIQELQKAQMSLEYRTTTNTAPDDSALSSYVQIFKQQTAFYNSLTDTILNSWLPNKWFDVVLTEVDQDDIDDWDWDDYYSANFGDDWDDGEDWDWDTDDDDGDDSGGGGSGNSSDDDDEVIIDENDYDGTFDSDIIYSGNDDDDDGDWSYTDNAEDYDDDDYDDEDDEDDDLDEDYDDGWESEDDDDDGSVDIEEPSI